MTTFYFVRHGKTELNVLNSFQGGGIDSPLLAEGIEQAGQLGKYLSDVAFSAAAVSTQKRAMDTAAFVLAENAHLDGLTVRYHDGLREMGFGDKEGIVVDLENQQTQYLRTRPDLYDPTEFSGETYDELIDRIVPVINQLEAEHPNGKVLVVAHGVVLIVLINYLTGKEKQSWRENGPLENTSVTILDKAGDGYSLNVFNDISYQS
ncbi:histidine phosphatase family protein [Enterococcus sp. BWR-S5]|uniref:histidine phosphatase family protein n=1 Tax=Enterococcus sp. BWR-S5 TaxID=2787714 RepID=UPI0019243E1D|nr:histidine phosphatase family protein [Enterococcus sp. BWR-S5]MBL1224913.1 histidine phosphatase family protein [Enterococcus sp. BWR-S5]